MSEGKYPGDGNPESFTSSGGGVGDLRDVFEVVDVMVKEESGDLDIVLLEDIESLPGPSQPQTQDGQHNHPVSEATADYPPTTQGNDVTAGLPGNNVSQSATFRCQKCGKTFTDHRRLRRHDRDVHALVRIQCEICNYSSARKDHLQRHYQCWHKERWAPTLGWWKRVTQKNRTRAKAQYYRPDGSRRGSGSSSGNPMSRPDGIRRSSAGNSGNVVPRQRSSGAPRTSVHPIANRERSMGSYVPRVSPSTLPSSMHVAEVPTLWSSLSPVSSPGNTDPSVPHGASLPTPVSMARSSNRTPPIAISSVVSLLQPPATMSPPQALSISPRSKQHDQSAQLASSGALSPSSARSTAFAGNSPQIVSLLQNASPPEGPGASRSASSHLALPMATASSAHPSSLIAAPSNSAVPSEISHGSRQRSPVAATSMASHHNARPATSVAMACAASNQNARPTATGAGNSSQIFSLLRTPSASTLGAGSTGAGSQGSIGPRNAPKPPSVVKVQAQVNQNQNRQKIPGSSSQSHAQPRTVSGGGGGGSGSIISQTAVVTADTPTKWATVEEKRTVKYFVDGRMIRQEEERVQSYKKIPAQWDMGIDVRDNFPNN